jgi:hypothetical protein
MLWRQGKPPKRRCEANYDHGPKDSGDQLTRWFVTLVEDEKQANSRRCKDGEGQNIGKKSQRQQAQLIDRGVRSTFLGLFRDSREQTAKAPFGESAPGKKSDGGERDGPKVGAAFPFGQVREKDRAEGWQLGYGSDHNIQPIVSGLERIFEASYKPKFFGFGCCLVYRDFLELPHEQHAHILIGELCQQLAHLLPREMLG